MTNPYSYVCHACNHPASIHLQAADDRALYECRDCGCRIDADAPTIGWNREQFEAYRATAPRRAFPEYERA